MTEQAPWIATLEWIKAFASLMAPVLALAGAVGLYFKKARDDRRDEARQRRAPLYEEYIDIISKVLAEAKDKSIAASAADVALALMPVHAKISIVAPPIIVEESQKYITSLVTLQGSSYRKAPSEVSDMVEKLAHLEMNRQLGNARQRLVNAFRQDIYPDAAELPKAMVILDQPEHSVLKQFVAAAERATKEKSQ